MNRKKRQAAVLFAILAVPFFAADLSLTVAGSPFCPSAGVRFYHGTSEISGFDEMMGKVSPQAEISASCPITGWFSAGLSVAYRHHFSDYTEKTFFTVPVYADFSFRPPVEAGGVTFPLTVSTGFYGQVLGNRVSFGPALRVSLGVDWPITDIFGLLLSTQHELLFAPDSLSSRVDLYYNWTPVSIGLRFLLPVLPW